MIRKLKIKFIVLAMASIFSLLAIIVTAMNTVNYNTVVNESDAILELLTQKKKNFIEFCKVNGTLQNQKYVPRNAL